MAALVSGPGNGATGGWDIELLRNKLVRAAEVTDPRRWDRDMSLEVPEELLSEDMVARNGVRNRVFITRWNQSPATGSATTELWLWRSGLTGWIFDVVTRMFLESDGSRKGRRCDR
jgi:hypothetical protein